MAGLLVSMKTEPSFSNKNSTNITTIYFLVVEIFGKKAVNKPINGRNAQI